MTSIEQGFAETVMILVQSLLSIMPSYRNIIQQISVKQFLLYRKATLVHKSTLNGTGLYLEKNLSVKENMAKIRISYVHTETALTFRFHTRIHAYIYRHTLRTFKVLSLSSFFAVSYSLKDLSLICTHSL